MPAPRSGRRSGRRGHLVGAILAATTLLTQAGELEKRLMDDLLAGLGDESLTREVRILTRLDRLYIEERPVPAYDPGTNQLVLLTRPWWKTVYYTTRPEEGETTEAPALAACPGESEPFTFALYPARDAVVHRIQVSPPVDASGNSIPPEMVRVYRERHIFVAPQKDIRSFRPFALEPIRADLPLLSNATTRFWVDLAVPRDAASGVYSGRVDIATDAGEFAFPYTLTVYPFALLKPGPSEMAWGFWFPPPREPGELNKHLRLMAACGITTFAFENWEARVDKQGRVDIETTALDQTLDAAEAQGLTGPFLIGVGLGEFPGSGMEYTPPWKPRYQEAIRQFSRHMTRRRTPFIALVFDEPRETNIRPCNRNREQMLDYLALIDQAAPELRTMVNPMSDETSKEFPQGFYTVFAEKFDLVMPHFWARSSNLIARARQPGGAELWSYNDGPNRLGWGLHSWANRLHGRMQYAWLLNKPKDHPYSPVQRGDFEYSGFHPGRHLWAVDLGGHLNPTPRLLAIREGIDDYRYLYTLERRLEQPGNPTVKAAAQAWLDEVRKSVPAYAHAADFVDETAAGDSETDTDFTTQLDDIRARAANFLRALSAP